MLRGRAQVADSSPGAGALPIASATPDRLNPATPGLRVAVPARAMHRSASGSALGRGWEGPVVAAAAEDLEAPGPTPGSPKKADPPAHRRKRPLLLMFGLLMASICLGALLIATHCGSGSGDGINAPTESQSRYLGRSAADLDALTVEFTAPGLFVPLKNALSLNFSEQPEEAALLRAPLGFADATSGGTDEHLNRGRGLRQAVGADGPGVAQQAERSMADLAAALQAQFPLSGGAAAGIDTIFDAPKHPEEEWQVPEGVRLLVAVTSACCARVSLRRRAAIRATWGALTRARCPYADAVDVRFFLAQPKDDETLRRWGPALAAEAAAHNDTVFVRGADTYLNLPNKTFRTLRWALAHPRGYTHFLKVDDDTWVRVHRVLEALTEPEPALGMGGLSSGSLAAGLAAVGRRRAMLEAAAVARKKEMARMSGERGTPIVSDGMALYDAASIVMRLNGSSTSGSGGALPSDTVDDIDGAPITLEELANRANWTISTVGTPDSAGDENRRRRRRHLTAFQGSLTQADAPRARMSGVYMGCVEVRGGFKPVRDPSNKWYISPEDLPDDAVPAGRQYLAGWGYLLSRDLVAHVVQKINAWELEPDTAPRWFRLVPWEDVVVGLAVADVVPRPHTHPGFRPAWRSCAPGTAVRHLDVDSPALLAGLVAQDVAGLADVKPVQCSSGLFLPGDYAGWAAWKAGLGTGGDDEEKEGG